jgi:16S rRNA (uracil1498-N3)-methyltransferase
MSSRFFHSTPITSERVTLDGPEAHHLLHVGRTDVGHGVTLFDGSGAEFTAVVEKLGRSAVELRVVERIEVDRELPLALTVGVALPKGERQKWLVEKLTELGVTALVPLVTERGVAQPTAGAIDRLRRNVVEASKQCGRNRLMQVDEPKPLGDWLVSSGHNADGAVDADGDFRLIAHPGGSPFGELSLDSLKSARVAIGPEGGFTDAEVAVATAVGWQKIALGQRILRVETAAVALAATIALRT